MIKARNHTVYQGGCGSKTSKGISSSPIVFCSPLIIPVRVMGMYPSRHQVMSGQVASPLFFSFELLILDRSISMVYKFPLLIIRTVVIKSTKNAACKFFGPGHGSFFCAVSPVTPGQTKRLTWRSFNMVFFNGKALH